MDYRIEKRDAFRVAAKTRYFNDETSKTEIPKFWQDYFRMGLDEKVCGMLGICIQAENNAKEWKYGIGCETKYLKEIPEDFELLEIPAYTWAIFTCIGAMPDAIQNQWKKVYSEWLPASNYELIQDYDFEFYTEGDTSKDDYVSEIWIPVKEKN